MVITAALRTCLYGSERMDRFVKKVKLTSDAPSTTAVCNSPSDATLQSSARQVADYEGYRAEVSLTFHSLSFVIRLTLEVLTFAQAAECIHKLYDVSAELILYCSF